MPATSLFVGGAHAGDCLPGLWEAAMPATSIGLFYPQ